MAEQNMIINLNESELLYLVFWYAASNYGHLPEEQELYRKIIAAWESIQGKKLEEIGISGNPKYQPGEDHE